MSRNKDVKEKESKKKNTDIFKKLLTSKNDKNLLGYFKNNVPISDQSKIIKEMKEMNSTIQSPKPQLLQLFELDIPAMFKPIALRKIHNLSEMDASCGEYFKMKSWVDTFMKIPFNKYNNLPVNISDGLDKCHDFMSNSKDILDSAVYGLNDAKLQIMQLIGQWLVNPTAVGTAIAIKGPMGTGKTTLVKEGISKILNRPYQLIALGGATDSSFLEGHSYTYEGSTYGKIVDILIQSKSSNPVIFFDELDKVSDSPKGDEITGILTHLTDSTQNCNFHDKYFSEIDFDLSRALIIFSYNDESKINPILKDRMYQISTKGYTMEDKINIAQKYLLPKIYKDIKFETSDIVIPEEILKHIIKNNTENEDGVRNLKRCLEIIFTKLNLYRLMKPGMNLFTEELTMNVTFPIELNIDMIEKLIRKKPDEDPGKWLAMYQ